ncbi:MAG TPA: anion permease [Chloroflexi bacterium]|nr:anion permease [Chloroflexota bacterium]
MLYFLIAASVIFDFLNGFHDSSNIVATVISSRAMKPRTALIMTAIAEFTAPFIFGVAVAKTVGSELIEPHAITITVVLAAVLAAILWNLITWLIGMPSSSSHALLGGLLGAAVLASGFGAVKMEGLIKILLALLLSPPLGFIVAFLLMKLILFLSRGATPKINEYFRRSQVLTSLSLAFSHGSNDAQKTMGIITMGLIAGGWQDSFHVPTWVILLSASGIALGTAFGGWRLIRTLGGRIYKIRPVDAFTSQLASTGVILGASLLGGPVSTTQVVGSSIMGAGAADRPNKVRWHIGKEMLLTWVLTIPCSASVAALIYWPLSLIFSP